MPEKDLKYYCNLFEKLRRDYKNGGAPHKPILLISLIQAFQQKVYTTNEIAITPELVGLFKSNWKTLVETNHQCLFTLPFFHLSSEPFWSLIPNLGCEMWVNMGSSMRSFNNLTAAVKFAKIDEELSYLLSMKEESSLLLYLLLDKYFPITKTNFERNGNNYLFDIESQILQEPQQIYQKRLLKIREQLTNDEFQEEVFIRSGIFKKEIPKIYDFTCCISRLRIDVAENISMIDACHIIPFSESYNDTITNGIALCPNLHRAFDRGLISVNNNFEIIVNKRFTEPNKSSHSIKQFEGSKILLPNNPQFYPSIESLKSHRKRFGVE